MNLQQLRYVRETGRQGLNLTMADVVAGSESRTVVVTDPDSHSQRCYRLSTPAQP